MWITVGNLNSLLSQATEDERSWLLEYLSFEDARARFRTRQYGDGRVRMFNLVSNTFPTGFLPLVKKAGADAGFKVEVRDLRQPPCVVDAQADITWLRDYQLACLQAVETKARGILWVPTGGGKTEVAVAAAQRLPCRWLFVVHRATLMHQAAERYELRTGETAGRVGEGVWDVRRFTCATFQTLYARLADPAGLQLLSEAEGLVIDEAHTLPADTFWRVVMKTQNAYYRIGMSGTPLARGDKRSVLTIAALGPVIYRIKPEVLIQAGVLARPKIRMLPVAQLSDKPTWQGVYGECIVRSKPRNRLIVRAAQQASKPCLVFVKEIKHGRLLLDALRAVGVSCEFVWGSDPHERRMAAVKRLERGDIEVLVCSAIFNEGVDIPALSSVVIASGGKSVIAALQRVGRGMRSDGGKKTEFEVWDVADRGNKWLERHTRDRVKAYCGEGYETIVEVGAVPESPGGYIKP